MCNLQCLYIFGGGGRCLILLYLFISMLVWFHRTHNTYRLLFHMSCIASDNARDDARIDFWTLSFTSSNYWGECYVINVESSYNNALNSKPWTGELAASLDNVTSHSSPQCVRLCAVYIWCKSNMTTMTHVCFLLNYTANRLTLVVWHIDTNQPHA